MNSEILALNVKTEGASDYAARMYSYIPDSNGRTMRAVIIFPGGGYSMTSYNEGEPIALALAARGFAAFVVRYSVAPAVYPQALCEAAMAIRTVKENAGRWNIDPDKIFVCGFSAGGHLAAHVSVSWNDSVITDHIGGSPEDYRICGSVLGYPVIVYGKYSHRSSFQCLLGEKFTDENAEKFSLEKRVNDQTPPAFVWHTYDDNCVPSINSIEYVRALAIHGVPAELHIYPHGEHGLSLGTVYCAQDPGNPKINEDVQGWIDLAAKWMDRL